VTKAEGIENKEASSVWEHVCIWDHIKAKGQGKADWPVTGTVVGHGEDTIAQLHPFRFASLWYTVVDKAM
jgi:hypothetical protein